jgi:adenosylhomocysteine nucleosidase
MAILYVAAEALELKPFAERLEGLKKLKWPLDYAFEGILNGERVMLAANGAGPKLAALAVEVAIRAVAVADLSASRLEAVISTGFCGGIDPLLRPQQIVIGTAIIDRNNGEKWDCTPLPDVTDRALTQGEVVSQDRIAVTAAQKRDLAASGAIAVEMEALGVAIRTKRAGLPFFCIKVVSDAAEESFGFDLNEMRTSEGRIARGRIVSYVLKHPMVLPELLRLKRRGEDAAKALGDFLVGCRVKPEPDRILAEH